jgi:putative heme transporter
VRLARLCGLAASYSAGMTSAEIEAALADAPEDELVRVELDAARKRKRTGWGRIIAIAVSIAVIAVVFAFALPKIADYGAVWGVVKGLSWPWIVVLVGAVCLDVGTYAPPWMAALPGLGYQRGTRVTLASTALSAVAPGGPAVGMATSFTMLKAWGFEGRPVGLAVAVTSVWNQLVILGVPILAVAGVLAGGGGNKTVELVALIALAVFVVIVVGFSVGLTSPRLARRLGDRAARTANWIKGLFHRAPVKWNGEAFVRFRDEAVELVRRRWAFLTFATLANHLTVFVVLVASLRAVGVPRAHVTIVEAFAAWALARVLGSIPITPGGVGFVELGLTGALVAFGATSTEAVAATLIYRFLTIVPMIGLGLLAAATWKVGGRPTEAAAANSPSK